LYAKFLSIPWISSPVTAPIPSDVDHWFSQSYRTQLSGPFFGLQPNLYLQFEN
jgi:hypothetical protein